MAIADAVSGFTDRTTDALGRSQLTTTASDNSLMGKDVFLQLLITEMRYQDPLSPISNQESIAQLAQFSVLEQMQNVNANLEYLHGLYAKSSLASLIGKTVTYHPISSEGPAGEDTFEVATGKIDGISYAGEVPMIQVNGKEIDLDQIISLQEVTGAEKE